MFDRSLVVMLGVALWLCVGSAPAAGARVGAPPVEIVVEGGGSGLASAAREVRRYAYLRAGLLLPIRTEPSGGARVTIAIDPALGEQSYRLRSVDLAGGRALRIEGGSGVAALYGAYEFARLLGVRFGLEGDIVPDGLTELEIPEIDRTYTPLFEHRGIQPFHDFPEGPDWWSLDDYKTVLSQLAKLRMNWFGLHCYPEGGVGPEPAVWIGLPGDVREDGSVSWAYPSRWASTSGGSWGYGRADPKEFAAGAGLLFSSSDFGSPVTDGHRALPGSPEDSAEVFDRAGEFLDEAFTHAERLGVMTVLGTETPLTIPASVRERLVERGMDPDDPARVRTIYEGMFRRIAAAHPLDCYWLWTPEGWTWGGNDQQQLDATLADLDAAQSALDSIGNPFTLGTCGWVLGPVQDRSLFDTHLPAGGPIACINREVGFAPVDPGFARMGERPKWAIPWMEDDPALIVPQLWVGRLRRDAADASAYGCTGLMGIHWRTKILGPNVAALADAAWDQTGWNPEPGVRVAAPAAPTSDVRLGGNPAAFTDPIGGTDADPVYQTVRWNVRGYRVRVPNGEYTVTLQFCEPHWNEAGRRVFGVSVQGERVVESLDIFARVGHDRALDLSFPGVAVTDETLAIGFEPRVEYPSIAGIVIEGVTAGSNQVESGPFERRINCAGAAWDGYEADLPDVGEIGPTRDLPRDLSAEDFYLDWCRAAFGDEIAGPAAAVFTRLDSGGIAGPGRRRANLPRPSDWIAGPGGIVVEARPWSEVEPEYAFIGELERLRGRVRGAGNKARFEYWLNAFRYMRAVAHLGCTRGELDRRMAELAGDASGVERERLAKRALEMRIELAREWEQMMTLQLQATDTIGAIGTVANLEQHVRRNPFEEGRLRFLDCHDGALRAALGHDLPPEAHPTAEYLGKPRVFVTTARPSVVEGERLTISAIVLDRVRPDAVSLRWRPMGAGGYRTIAMRRVGGGVHRAELPPAAGEAVEWFVEATGSGGERLVWPPTAPERGQTVVVLPAP